MHPLYSLIEDHKKVSGLLDQLMQTSTRATKQREKLFAQLKNELVMHEKIEQKVLYPALKKELKARALALEAYEEHHLVNNILKEMNKLAYDDEKWKAKLTVLQENITHHIKEEEKQLFLQAEEIFGKELLKSMNKKMLELKNEMLERAA